MTTQDTSRSAGRSMFDNGTDPAADLVRMLAVRRGTVERFGEQALKTMMADLHPRKFPGDTLDAEAELATAITSPTRSAIPGTARPAAHA